MFGFFLVAECASRTPYALNVRGENRDYKKSPIHGAETRPIQPGFCNKNQRTLLINADFQLTRYTSYAKSPFWTFEKEGDLKHHGL